MSKENSVKICPVEKAGSLDNKVRRWLQNPRKILHPFVKEAMTVLDFGCGPGFFTLDLAILVGNSGKVIACDLQEGMLNKLEEKVSKSEIENRIIFHKCEVDTVGVKEPVDFILAFYVVHEIKDQQRLFSEFKEILKPGGQLLIIEPPFHVSKSAFAKCIKVAEKAGLDYSGRPKVRFSKTALFINIK